MIILTGGTGFIGSAILWQLNASGVSDVLVIDQFGSDKKWLNLRKRSFLDVMSPEAFSNDLQGIMKKAKAVIHMGAISSTTETDMDLLYENNVRFSMNLCLESQKANIPFLYASSAATYGLGENGFETSTKNIQSLRPINPYGYSKQLFDVWISQQKLTIPWFGFKFFNVYGPQEYHKGSQASVAFHAYHQIMMTDALKLFKSYREDFAHGEQKRDFVYVKDITEILEHVFTNAKEIPSGIYNLGTGKARSFLDLADAVFRAMGHSNSQIEFIAMPEHLKDQYQYFTEAEMQRSLKALNWKKPLTQLEAGIEDYVKNYLAHSDNYL